MRSNDDWAEAAAQVMERRAAYVELIGTPGVIVDFALKRIDKVMTRFNGGERSERLFEEMGAIE